MRLRHSYDARAATLLESLSQRMETGLFLPIKHGDDPALASLAAALRRALEALGHAVRLDPPAEWEGARAVEDDAVIALPGTLRFSPRTDQLAMLWAVRDFEHLSETELDLLCMAFLARPAMIANLTPRAKVPLRLASASHDKIRDFAQKVADVFRLLHINQAQLPNFTLR